MSEIHYKEFKKYLTGFEDKTKPDAAAPVYLIYGEEVLCKAALEALLDVLIPGKDRRLNYDPIDGANENIKAAIERVNTYSLLSGTKVVAIIDSRIFYSKEDENRLLEKAKAAFDADNLKTAGEYIISLMGLLNLTFEDLSRENRSKTLKRYPKTLDSGVWFDKILKKTIPHLFMRLAKRFLEFFIKMIIYRESMPQIISTVFVWWHVIDERLPFPRHHRSIDFQGRV